MLFVFEFVGVVDCGYDGGGGEWVDFIDGIDLFVG